MFALLYQPFLSYLQFSLYNWLKRSVCSLNHGSLAAANRGVAEYELSE
ncbi:Uncharacterised protein [Escherichia coli]|nr:Uncharacterised protein [Escherichia coli]SQV87187.1 Uncharacterised protein [Escherichia coli]SQW09971.1 Uncharacterised protein [Escherichia coli]SQW30047.1 Uncharacterised protein [Escherichia coli]SQW78234.1 Uncharacterised protein [Escherichia coli]